MIVITAPTSNIGHQVLANILDTGEPIRVIARDPARLPARTRECVEVVQGSHGDFNVVKDTIPPARNSREHTRRIPARHLRYRSPCLDRPQASVCRQSSFVVDTHDPGRQVTNAFGP
jgi:hypothetical protein